MTIPRTAADFRRWLRVEIAELANDHPDENHFWEAGGTIREARRIALALDRPDVAKLCRIGDRPLALPVAQEILSACLATLRIRRPADSQIDMLTPPQVARRYGVSPDTVRGWIASGELRAVSVGKGTRLPLERSARSFSRSA
jgi:excisionase family DNA binding protein